MKITQMEVTLIDSMGSDLNVVNAARVSFAKESEWEDNEPQYDGSGAFGWAAVKKEGDWIFRLSEKDQRLISYLAKHNHWTPFAHCFLSFRIKAPIFVARQLVKHQVGLAWNEVSRRYVDDEPEFFLPKEWRTRPEGNVKQGSGSTTMDFNDSNLLVDNWDGGCDDFHSITTLVLSWYNNAIKHGVAPEQARMILPLNTHTEWIWSGSLMAFARVVKLRTDSHAQAETREIAQLINNLVPKEFEHSWKALMVN